MKNNESVNLKNIKLYEDRGPTSRFVSAEINNSGDLVLFAHDIGEAAREYTGRDDYEWYVTVQTQNKDAVILALIERVFGGKFDASKEFREWLKEKGIPFELFCH